MFLKIETKTDRKPAVKITLQYKLSSAFCEKEKIAGKKISGIRKELLAGELVLWEPTHGRRARGRPSATFIDTLKRDLGTDDKLELEVCMTNQEDWRARRAARLRPP